MSKIKDILYNSKTITFLRQHNFAYRFDDNKIDKLFNILYYIENDPEFEFLDSDLEHLFKSLINNIKELY